MNKQRNKLINQLKQIEYLAKLASRELECLSLQVNCYKAKDIAVILRTSKRTVDTHLYHTRLKLGEPTLSATVAKLRALGVKTLLDKLCTLAEEHETESSLSS
jgi:FixJ family two-component response regulator